MWDKAFLFIFFMVLTYLFKKHTKVFNFILFYLKFSIIYICCTLVIFVWPFPILNGRTVENAKSWTRILKYLTVLVRVKWELRNGEVLAKDRGAVIVSNHQSCLDAIGMFNVWETGDKVIGLVKKDIILIWPMALAVYFSGGVFIDRRNPRNAYKQLQKTTDVMIKEKTKIWVFPEGTRNYDYSNFLPFKRGAFIIAVSAQTPIIPVVFSPYHFLDRKNYIFNKSNAIIRCLEEVPTTGLTMDDVPELIERVRNLMLAAYKELSDEVMLSKIKGTECF